MKKLFRFHLVALATSALLCLFQNQAAAVPGSKVSAKPLVARTVTDGKNHHSQIAVFVNKDVITASDIKARMRLAFLTLGLKETPEMIHKLRPQVINSLVEELLQIQAAKAHNVHVKNDSIEAEYKVIAHNQGMSPQQFTDFLRKHGISKSSFTARIRADISWKHYVQGMHGDTTVEDKEVDKFLKALEDSKNQTQHHVSEIFMAIRNPSEEASVKASMERLRNQINSGSANFHAIAQQFSEAASSNKGGDLGWVPEIQFQQELRAHLVKMKADEVSPVIRTPQGFYLLKLDDSKQAGMASGASTLVSFRQIALPTNKDSTPEQLQQIAAFVEEIGATQGCDEFAAKVKEKGGDAHLFQDISLQQLSGPTKKMMSETPTGKMLPPIPAPNGLALVLAMVCSKRTAEVKPPSREEVRLMLVSKKLAQFAARDMNKLRSIAYVSTNLPQNTGLRPVATKRQSQKAEKKHDTL